MKKICPMRPCVLCGFAVFLLTQALGENRVVAENYSLLSGNSTSQRRIFTGSTVKAQKSNASNILRNDHDKEKVRQSRVRISTASYGVERKLQNGTAVIQGINAKPSLDFIRHNKSISIDNRRAYIKGHENQTGLKDNIKVSKAGHSVKSLGRDAGSAPPQSEGACHCAPVCGSFETVSKSSCTNSSCTSCAKSKKAEGSPHPKAEANFVPAYSRHVFQAPEKRKIAPYIQRPIHTLNNPLEQEISYDKSSKRQPLASSTQTGNMNQIVNKSLHHFLNNASKIHDNLSHRRTPKKPSMTRNKTVASDGMSKKSPAPINPGRTTYHSPKRVNDKFDDGESLFIKLSLTSEQTSPIGNVSLPVVGEGKMLHSNETFADFYGDIHIPRMTSNVREFEMRKAVPRYSRKDETKQEHSNLFNKTEDESRIQMSHDITKKSKPEINKISNKDGSLLRALAIIGNSTEVPVLPDSKFLSNSTASSQPVALDASSAKVTSNRLLNNSLNERLLQSNNSAGNASFNFGKTQDQAAGAGYDRDSAETKGTNKNFANNSIDIQGSTVLYTHNESESRPLNQTRRANITDLEDSGLQNPAEHSGVSSKLNAELSATLSTSNSAPYSETGSTLIPENTGEKEDLTLYSSEMQFLKDSVKSPPESSSKATLKDNQDWFGSQFSPDERTKADLKIRNPLIFKSIPRGALKKPGKHASSLIKDVVGKVEKQEWKEMDEILSSSLGKSEHAQEDDNDFAMVNDEAMMRKIIEESEGSGADENYAGDFEQEDTGDENYDGKFGRIDNNYKDDYEYAGDIIGDEGESMSKEIDDNVIDARDFDDADDPEKLMKSSFTKDLAVNEDSAAKFDFAAASPEESVDAIEQKLQILKDKHLINRKEKIRETLAMVKKIESDIDRLVKEEGNQEGPADSIGAHALERDANTVRVRTNVLQEQKDQEIRKKHAYDELVHPRATNRELKGVKVFKSHMRPQLSEVSATKKLRPASPNLKQDILSMYRQASNADLSSMESIAEGGGKPSLLQPESSSTKLLLPKTISDMAEQDRVGRLQQAATLINLQKAEAQTDLQRLQYLTRTGLQELFSKAVAKQQKFINDVAGPSVETTPSLDQAASMPFQYPQYYSQNSLLAMHGGLPMLMPYPSTVAFSPYRSYAIIGPANIVSDELANKKSDMMEAGNGDNDSDDEGDDDDVPSVEDRDDYDER